MESQKGRSKPLLVGVGYKVGICFGLAAFGLLVQVNVHTRTCVIDLFLILLKLGHQHR